MDWMKIGSALLLIMMLVYLWPRAKQMLDESAEAKDRDWMGFLLPVAAVVGFVILLMAIV